MGKQQARRESFVVRIWQEQGQSAWKGWVQHVRSGESALLDDVDDVSRFVKRWINRPADERQRGLK